MSNLLQFPADAARLRPLPLAENGCTPRGEIVLFTGVRYMRHPEQPAAKAPAEPDSELRQG